MMKLRARLKSLTRTDFTLETSADPAEIEKLKDKELDVEIKLHREHRSLDANACLWACLGELAGVLGITNWDMYLLELKAYGQFENISAKKVAFKHLETIFRAIEPVDEWTVTEEVINPVTGYPEEVEVPWMQANCYYGSHYYNTKEFSRLLSGVIEDMKAAGLTPPPSEDMRRMLREMELREQKKDNKGD